MNVNDGTVPCPVCGDAIQGSTLIAIRPLRARAEKAEADLANLRPVVEAADALIESMVGFAVTSRNVAFIRRLEAALVAAGVREAT